VQPNPGGSRVGGSGAKDAPRRVLLVTVGLVGRTGTEVVTLETARGLRDRGCDVAIYAPQVGALGETMRASGFVVTKNAEFGDWVPDLIQANQTYPLVTVVCRFPDVPVVTICHDARVWYSEPLDLPNIQKQLAVDDACRERIATALPHLAEHVEVLHNSVDLDQFRPRARLPHRPRRALILTKHASHVDAIRAACADIGLSVEALGSGVGREVDDLPARLPEFDLVFATARMALEALAVGCAVIVVDGRGLAGLVTLDVVASWRHRNFGFSLLTRTGSHQEIVSEIQRYDADDAGLVSQFIRRNSSLSAYLNRLEQIHTEVLARSPARPIDRDFLITALGQALVTLTTSLERQMRERLESQAAEWNRLHETSLAWNSELTTAIKGYGEQNAELRRGYEESRSWSSELTAVVKEYAKQNAELRRGYEESRSWSSQLSGLVESYAEQNAQLRRAYEESQEQSSGKPSALVSLLRRVLAHR
jgi:Glycosyltransferase Family 4